MCSFALTKDLRSSITKAQRNVTDEASARPIRDLRASLDSFERIDYTSDEISEGEDQTEGLQCPA